MNKFINKLQYHPYEKDVLADTVLCIDIGIDNMKWKLEKIIEKHMLQRVVTDKELVQQMLGDQ